MSDLAELDRIAAEASIDVAAAAPVAPAEAAPAVSLEKELSGLAEMLVGVLSPALPSLKCLYTAEAIGAASASVSAVCVKHGWLQGGLMGEWGEEVTALIVCGPLAVATVQGVKGDLARLKAKAGKAEAAAVAVSPAPTLGEPAGAAPADLLPPQELTRG